MRCAWGVSDGEARVGGQPSAGGPGGVGRAVVHDQVDPQGGVGALVEQAQEADERLRRGAAGTSSPPAPAVQSSRATCTGPSPASPSRPTRASSGCTTPGTGCATRLTATGVGSSRPDGDPRPQPDQASTMDVYTHVVQARGARPSATWTGCSGGGSTVADSRR